MKALGVLVGVLGSGIAAADNECRSVDVDFVPSEKLQTVAWVEDSAGHYVDTAFITQSVGLRGIGNRVGVMDIQSGPLFPFGSRLDVAPIWAHRHGLSFPQLICGFQCDGVVTTDGDPDANPLHMFADSSFEPYFTRPMQPTEPGWDAGTAATPVFTDKGTFSPTMTSPYPPRADLTTRLSNDSADIEQFAEMNPFDSISQATPPGDQPYRFSWAAPTTLATGNYVLRVEVSKEFDFNGTYTPSTFPTTQSMYTDYGLPYRGQPAVLYEVPFTIASTATSAQSLDYVGYADLDGSVHAPDATITTDTPGSGASRLRVTTGSGGSPYRVRVSTQPDQDSVAPAAPSAPAVETVEPTHASLTFTAPGDDGAIGTVAGYDIRYRVGYDLDEATFAGATPYAGTVVPVAAGQIQEIAFDELAPHTPYVVGIRAYDNCRHEGPLVAIAFETPTQEVGCGCNSGGAGDMSGFAIIAAGLGLRRRRRRSSFE